VRGEHILRGVNPRTRSKASKLPTRLVRFLALVLITHLAASAAAKAETAQSAGRFVDSIGMNVHLSYTNTAYGNVPELSRIVKDLGVRHLRDGITTGDAAPCRIARELGERGVRFDYITRPGIGRDALTAWARCVGPVLEAYEGPNEYDISHPRQDTNWVTTLQSYQQELYSSVKGTPALAKLAVIGPSATTEQAYRSIGDLSAFMDYGNIHNYFAGRNPETGGWGDNGYGSIAWNTRVANVVMGAKTIETTETGYGTSSQKPGVPLDVQANYVPRMFLEQFARDIPRTYEYQLLDGGGDAFDSFGLVSKDFQPKPAYDALRSLIELLEEPALDPATGSMSYRLSGSLTSVHHVLLKKHDGRYYLVLWLAASDWDVNTSRRLTVPPQNVTLSTDGAMKAATLYQYDAQDRLRPVKRWGAVASLTVDVKDSISVVELVPADRRSGL